VIGLSPPGLRQETLRFQRGSPEGDLTQRAREAVERLVGSHGVVRRCQQFPVVPGLPKLPVFVARGPRRGFGGRDPGFDVIGMGVAEDAEDARLKAVVEAVERYCFAWRHDPSLVHRCAYRDIDRWAVPLERFRPYSEQQYRAGPALRFPGPSEPIDWSWAYSLTGDRFALVPAVVAYASVGFRPPNNFSGAGSSTGVASHVSMDAALLAGLLEVVERDALMIHWLNRRSPRRITTDGAAPGGTDALLRRHFRLPDFEFVLIDITGDSGIPTVGCLATSDNPEHPACAFGSASRLDPDEAARKALFETAQVLSGLYGLGLDARSSFPESAVRNIWDHARFYAAGANFDRVEFLTRSTERVRIGDLPALGTGRAADDLQECVTRLAGIGLEVFAVDLTTADVAACGLRTVKVVVPGMVDISGDARHTQLGFARVHRMPEAMGWPALGEGELNLAPGPLA
jgi:ribosomal protein S12 methylthiotransferase accessory factor